MQQIFLVFYLLLAILAETDTDSFNFDLTADPTTVELFPTYSYETEDCLMSFTSMCDPLEGYPMNTNAPIIEFEKFEYVSIRSVVGSDEIYEVTLEIELNTSIDPSNLFQIWVSHHKVPDPLASDPAWIYAPMDGILFDSPYHFFVKWAMSVQSDGNQVCTTPFIIFFRWMIPNEYGNTITEAQYAHYCDENGNANIYYPLQCWDPVCSEETTSEPGTTTEAEETTEQTTTEQVSTYTISNTDLPEPVNCPDSLISQIVPDNCLGNGNELSSPNVEIFRFVSVKWLENDVYEAIIEFKLNSEIIPEGHEYNVYFVQLMSDGSETQTQIVFSGGSHYHFYISWASSVQTSDSLTCIGQFYIMYQASDGSMWMYGNGCDSEWTYLPNVCWSEECNIASEETTATKTETASETDDDPVTISYPRTDLPEPIDCPSSWNGDSVCTATLDRTDSGVPPVEIFRFESIKWIQGDSYEVLIEFKLDSSVIPESAVDAINIPELHTPDDYLTYIMAYSRGLPVYPLSEGSLYHFYLSFVMEAQSIDDFTCTTPIVIIYVWNSGEHATYAHGCTPDDYWEGDSDLPLQCWQEECIRPLDETSTDTQVETSLIPESEETTTEEAPISETISATISESEEPTSTAEETTDVVSSRPDLIDTTESENETINDNTETSGSEETSEPNLTTNIAEDTTNSVEETTYPGGETTEANEPTTYNTPDPFEADTTTDSLESNTNSVEKSSDVVSTTKSDYETTDHSEIPIDPTNETVPDVSNRTEVSQDTMEPTEASTQPTEGSTDSSSTNSDQESTVEICSSESEVNSTYETQETIGSETTDIYDTKEKTEIVTEHPVESHTDRTKSGIKDPTLSEITWTNETVMNEPTETYIEDPTKDTTTKSKQPIIPVTETETENIFSPRTDSSATESSTRSTSHATLNHESVTESSSEATNTPTVDSTNINILSTLILSSATTSNPTVNSPSTKTTKTMNGSGSAATGVFNPPVTVTTISRSGTIYDTTSIQSTYPSAIVSTVTHPESTFVTTILGAKSETANSKNTNTGVYYPSNPANRVSNVDTTGPTAQLDPEEYPQAATKTQPGYIESFPVGGIANSASEVPSSNGNPNTETKPESFSLDPAITSGTPNSPPLYQDPNVKTHTIPTTIGSDRSSSVTSSTIGHSTTPTDDIPGVVNLPTESGSGSSEGSSGANSHSIGEFEGASSSTKANIFIICLCLFFIMIFV